MQLSIIIVNYNVQFFLEQCLCSVAKAIQQIDAEVFVVDNCSSDNSKQYLTPKFAWVKFKWNVTNEGFGNASNSVLEEATGRYLLFLNPDTILPEDALLKTVQFFNNTPNCGALGVRMIDGSGRFLKESKRGMPTPFSSFSKMIGLANLFPKSRLFADYYQGHLSEHITQPVAILAGAFMMMSKKAIEATNGFDEQFFMYGEDVDLSYRITQAGFTNYYFADTSIVHFKGESSQRRAATYFKYFYGAMSLFVNKHYADRKLTRFLMNTAIRLGAGIAALNRLFDTEKKQTGSTALLTAVVATQPTFNRILQIIKNAEVPLMLVGRIALNNEDTEPAIGHIQQLDVCIQQYQIQQIILCEDSWSFAAIIQLVEEHAGKTAFLFHAANSGSVVGSNNKNTNGIFIAADVALATPLPNV
ncbi:MAG: glycosyltransferase family 2 protein [Ferruginibacter sp.]